MTAFSSFEAFEDDRLRAHFEWVIAILRAQDTSALDADLAARRSSTIAELEAYAERGEFPRNTVSLEAFAPAFVDDRGVACAVADLMMRSGDDGVLLAGRIRDRLNLASIGEMLGAMPDELAAWAQRAGLTPVEMALIQPSYCGPLPECHYWSENAPGGLGLCPGTEPCCTATKVEDGQVCHYSGVEGVCTNGWCGPEPEEETEEPVDDHDAGCDCSMTNLGAGSIAPLFAALALLAWRRRAARHRRP